MPTLAIEHRDDAERLALEQCLAHFTQLRQTALTAADGTVLAACGQVVLRDGRALLQSSLACSSGQPHCACRTKRGQVRRRFLTVGRARPAFWPRLPNRCPRLPNSSQGCQGFFHLAALGAAMEVIARLEVAPASSADFCQGCHIAKGEGGRGVRAISAARIKGQGDWEEQLASWPS